MARRFEFAEGSSSKFWEVAVDGNTMTVVFGKIGTPGQNKPKRFASPAAAQKEADKLVGEKTKKGYVEVGAAVAPARVPAAKKKAAPHPEYAVFLKAGDGFFGEPDFGEVTFGESENAEHYVDSADGAAWAELFTSVKWFGQEADGGVIGLYEGAILYLDNEGSLHVTSKTLIDHFAWKKMDEALDALNDFAAEHGLPAPLAKKAREASIKGVPSPQKKLEALLTKHSAPATDGVRPVDRHPTIVQLDDGRAVVISCEDDVHKRKSYDSHAAFLFARERFTLLPETPFKSYLSLHAAGALPDGRAVFVSASDTLRVLIFDTVANEWTAGPELKVKQEHPSVAMLKDGRVMVAGGEVSYSRKASAIQLFDLAKKKWSTASGKLATPRARAATVVLSDGRVLLLAGEVESATESDACEVFDPKKGACKKLTSVKGDFSMPQAVALSDGRVLLADQSGCASIYDPAKGSWGKLLNDERIGVPAVQLGDGRVAFFKERRVSLLDTKTLKLSSAGQTLVGHGLYSGAVAIGGKALLVGGDLYNNIASEPEIYDSATSTSAPIIGFEKQMKKQQAALAKRSKK